MLRLYTDGSYAEASGVGSWAWLLVEGEERRRGSGAVEGGTTAQRMELTAVAEGLTRLPLEFAAAELGQVIAGVTSLDLPELLIEIELIVSLP